MTKLILTLLATGKYGIKEAIAKATDEVSRRKIQPRKPQRDIAETPLFGQKRLADERRQAAAQRSLFAKEIL